MTNNIFKGNNNINTNVSLAFVGAVVPDLPEFETPAFSRAGNMFQLNVVQSITGAGICPSAVLSYLPIPSFPRSKQLWVRGRSLKTGNGLKIKLVSFVNITPIKQLCIGIGVCLQLFRWRWVTRAARHHVIYCYNLTVPPGIMIYLTVKLIRAKIIVAVNDINVPGHTVPAGFLSYIDYWMQKFIISRLDGRVVVAEEIIRTFSPNCHFIRMEGGINRSLIQLQKLSGKNKKEPLNLVMAGSLEEVNGVKELLGALTMVSRLNVRLHIAGNGPLAEDVKKAANKDARIEYLGLISYEKVLQLYKSADVLINMRLTQRLNSRFFFPSKLIEYLATGVPVISTCPGHVETEYGRFCYLLKNESPEALAALIERVGLLPPEERFKLGQLARSYMLENKTWEIQGQRIVNYIQQTVLGLKC